MAYNGQGAPISVSVLGGYVSEMTPPDLPNGVSPDCADVEFVPGSVSSRRGLLKVFAAAFPAGPSIPTVTYAKSFVNPLGGIENLYLDSNGALWWEDLTNAPGAYTQIGTLPAGSASYARSVTAFGREFIAPSDGMHGTDVPLQWDGTNLDRVTQDGPGAAPTVTSTALPAVAMVATGALVLTLTESDPTGAAGGGFTRINAFTSTAVTNVNVGDLVTVAGCGGASAPMNGTWPVLAVYPGAVTSLVVLDAYLPSTTVFSVAAATGTISTGTMVRANNIVTVKCAVAHNLQAGFQAQITGVPAQAIGGGIASIVIKNEDIAGIATITTNAAHGLLPGIYVSLTGVTGVVVGTGIGSIARAGNVLTITTTAPHGLSPGAVVTTGGVATASFNSTLVVLTVNSTTVFTCAQVDADAALGAGGTVTLNWPIPNTPTPTYFEVVAAPTSTTFQVAINYSNGTWASGAVSYAWSGTFFVYAVPDAQRFQYRQYGPDAATNSVGTVTPYGQAAPGIKQCRVHFLTRQGYITRPSPPVKVVASGGQYFSVSNIPIGPSNVVARILSFTGSGGSSFFYIPSTPQVNGQIVGTATQINDNTTTSILLDFSDLTLFAATGVSIPGNDLASQIVLDGALGFGFYASRLITWGQRNRIQNLLNMGFDGGYQASDVTLAAGWIPAAGGAGGALANGHYGKGWLTAGAGSISQSFYQDAYGAPIATVNTKYRLRAWVKTAASSVTVTISAASTGFASTATVNGTAAGAFGEAAFSVAMPAAIPTDLILSVAGAGGALVDELSIIYADNPYLETILYGSYADNPEGFDGVSGKFGPSQDTKKVMACCEIRDSLYLLTKDPGGRLHDTSDNGVTEPAGWGVLQVAANCGALSTFGVTVSQGDDGTASGGEEWMAWASSSGARIFGGDQPFKISQEIQPDWDRINPAYNAFTWALNDPKDRVIYFGLPLAGNPQGAANRIYVLNYRNLDTAREIAEANPIHIAADGKMSASDHGRKWAPWNLTMNGAALMFRRAGELSVVLLAGNGTTPGTLAGAGNVFTLSAAKLQDDTYGRIYPYYTTYFFPTSDESNRLQIGAGRQLLAYMSAPISGVGNVQITPLCNRIGNAWSITGTRALQATPNYDLEWSGGNAQGQRLALKFASVPTDTGVSIDNSFTLQGVSLIVRPVSHLPVRGAV